MVAVDLSMEPEFLHARYANLFRVGQNAHEMILDFGQVDPDSSAEAIHTRIVTVAAHARLLLGLLAEAVANYEEASLGPLAARDPN
jgi:hypothetical protein